MFKSNIITSSLFKRKPITSKVSLDITLPYPYPNFDKIGLHYCRFLDGDPRWYEKHPPSNRVECL